ncbi:MAG: cation:proton antiporter [Methylococcales bacterium]|nr:cation:proton antiporter [Methylococcales bacterium]MBT7445018.1 cation:proton antiporter [Methylococcales bacterium]
MLMHKNIIRIIVGFTLMDTGIHMVMVAIGYLTGGKAPIIEGANKNIVYVDPVPSALVLTSIVIGLGITAIMLSYAIQIHKAKKSLSIDDCAEMKW